MKKNFRVFFCAMLCMTLLLSALPVQAENEKGDLWLTDEKVTLTCWYPINQATFFSDGISSFADTDVFKWLEEQTNVHVEFIHPANSTEAESFNLLFADDRLPDLVFNNDTYAYAEGAEAAVEDGYYLRLNDLMEQYAPSYMKLMADNPTIAKDTATDSGLRWSFNFIYSGDGKQCNFGPALRKDFLDKTGLDAPVTYEDWHKVLTAFKELGVEYPLLLNYAGSCDKDGWMAGYGVSRTFFQQDGVAKFGPIEDGYGEYVNMMAQWYKEGLIYPDFALQSTAAEPPEDLVLNDRIGAWATFASWSGTDYYVSCGATNPDVNLVGVTHPVVSAGDETHLRYPDTIVKPDCIAVSADCEYPEIAVKWLDIFYNPDYAWIFNYGLREGESYVKDENGNLHWGDLINHNEEGITKNQARCKYTTVNCLYEDYTRVMGSWTPVQLESQQAWVSGKDDWVMPDKLTPTADENRQMSVLMEDINTFVLEETTKMIMGTSTYTFETFRQKILDMGIDQALAIEQQALDRYNAR